MRVNETLAVSSYYASEKGRTPVNADTETGINVLQNEP